MKHTTPPGPMAIQQCCTPDVQPPGSGKHAPASFGAIDVRHPAATSHDGLAAAAEVHERHAAELEIAGAADSVVQVGRTSSAPSRPAWRYGLLNQAVRLAGGAYKGLSKCSRYLIDPGEPVVIYQAAQGGRYLSNLRRCAAGVCPVCSPRIQMRRMRELAKTFETVVNQGGALLYPTLAAGYDQDVQALDARLGAFRIALKSLGSGRSAMTQVWKTQGYTGMCRVLEIVWHPRLGWLPHAHLVLTFSGAIPADLPAWLNDIWRVALDMAGLGAKAVHFGDVDSPASLAGYICKLGEDTPEGQRGSVTVAPMMLLARSVDDSVMADLFQEYAYAMRGVRRIESPRGLRRKLGLVAEQTDKTLNETVTRVDQQVAALTSREWRTRLDSGDFGTLL